MPSMEILDRIVQTVDFKILLPALARLPLWMGETLANTRGVYHAAMDNDWRSLALQQRFVRQRVYASMRMIRPDAGRRVWATKTLKRFIHNSREEWQAKLFTREVIDEIIKNSTIEGLPALKKARQEGRGLVLLTAHYDSYTIGMAMLGREGLNIHGISSNVTDDPRVNRAVSQFFYYKYRSMEPFLEGRIVHHEDDMQCFHDALKRGETVVILGDIPGRSTSISIPFFGKRFHLPLGAWHLAKKAGCPIGAFLCLHESTGKYRVVTNAPREIDPEDPLSSLISHYQFIRQWIARKPDRWLPSDLLSGYEDYGN